MDALSPLDESSALPDPLKQFRSWFEDAQSVVPVEPTACSLATASADGQPSVRTVLLKGYDAHGFVLYTNYDSRKGRQLLENPQAALSFWWPQQYRQVRIEGSVEKVSEQESDLYFESRPFGSQIGALASPQSAEISNRAQLDDVFAQLEKEWRGKHIPRPENWGGYRLKPNRFEFWQGRDNRLHDRIAYLQQDDGSWLVKRLAP